ncbi:hypothetical protein [Kocuria sp. CPCC 205263]|uniref:hypothetical protein n=1 Tax=Kocuria sp. CPCC 205263 TaxID=3073555 RepID=UPI0034D56784
MHTTQRIAAAAAAALLFAATPAGATNHEPAPPTEQPAEMQWPPASTHGKFVPFPEEFQQPMTFPACDSEVTLVPGDVDEREYRALVDTEGNTVVQFRGASTVDITRASDGAMLDEVDASGEGVEIFSADGESITFDWAGPAVVVAFDEVETQEFAEAGLPQAFLYLSGELTETVTFESEFQPGEEVPPVASAEITGNTTKYVFDLCNLLDQAAADQ